MMNDFLIKNCSDLTMLWRLAIFLKYNILDFPSLRKSLLGAKLA